MYASLTQCVRSGWLVLGQVLFCLFVVLRRLVSSLFDQRSLVNKIFIIHQKDFALIRIKNDLFLSRARTESQLCQLIKHNKPTRFVYVSLVLTVFCHIVQFHHLHCPKITNFVSLHQAFFSCSGSNCSILAHFACSGGQSEHRICIAI